VKKQSNIFWALVIIGSLGLVASVIGLLKGKEFDDYFWGGLMGVILIGSAFYERSKTQGNSGKQD
jgi:hypothetical protein